MQLQTCCSGQHFKVNGDHPWYSQRSVSETLDIATYMLCKDWLSFKYCLNQHLHDSYGVELISKLCYKLQLKFRTTDCQLCNCWKYKVVDTCK